jgi:hypothetical protein
LNAPALPPRRAASLIRSLERNVRPALVIAAAILAPPAAYALTGSVTVLAASLASLAITIGVAAVVLRTATSLVRAVESTPTWVLIALTVVGIAVIALFVGWLVIRWLDRRTQAARSRSNP